MTWGVTWGPGYRLFKCPECGHEWQERCRDCTSESRSRCPNPNVKHDGLPGCRANLYGGVVPHGHEKHFEWKTDAHGNLLDELS